MIKNETPILAKVSFNFDTRFLTYQRKIENEFGDFEDGMTEILPFSAIKSIQIRANELNRSAADADEIISITFHGRAMLKRIAVRRRRTDLRTGEQLTKPHQWTPISFIYKGSIYYPWCPQFQQVPIPPLNYERDLDFYDGLYYLLGNLESRSLEEEIVFDRITDCLEQEPRWIEEKKWWATKLEKADIKKVPYHKL
jgi:hypothetical protein